MPETSELNFEVLHGLVTLSKDSNIQSVKRLVEVGLAKGYELADIKVALSFWGVELRARYPDFDTLKRSFAL